MGLGFAAQSARFATFQWKTSTFWRKSGYFGLKCTQKRPISLNFPTFFRKNQTFLWKIEDYFEKWKIEKCLFSEKWKIFQEKSKHYFAQFSKFWKISQKKKYFISLKNWIICEKLKKLFCNYLLRKSKYPSTCSRCTNITYSYCCWHVFFTFLHRLWA